MAHPAERYFPYESVATPFEPDTPITYSVNYAWGSLHVSEEAHDRYKFDPLTIPKPGYSVTPNEGIGRFFPNIRLFMLAPGEAAVPLLLHPNQFHAHYQVHETDITAQLAFGSDKEEIVMQMGRSILGEDGLSDNRITFMDANGPLDARSVLNSRAAEMLLGVTCKSLAATLPDVLQAWQRHHEQQVYNQRVKGFTLRGMHNSLRARANNANKAAFAASQLIDAWSQDVPMSLFNTFSLDRFEAAFQAPN